MLREEHILKMSGNRVLRGIFELQREDTAVQKLRNL
jgi:hypothetical protein